MNGHCNNLEKDKHIPYVALKAHIDQYTSDCVFAANRFMRIPRLPLVIFPMIFQFISQKAKVPEESKPYANFFLQNMIYTCLLRAKHHHKIELNEREHNNFQKNAKFRRTVKLKGEVQLKPSDFKTVKSLGEETYNMTLEFVEFCKEEGMNVALIFDKYNELKVQEQEILGATLRYCYYGYLNFLASENISAEKILKTDHRQLDPNIAFFQYDISSVPQVRDRPVDPQKAEALKAFLWNQHKNTSVFPQQMFYQEKLDLMATRFLEFYESSEEKKKRSYRYFSEDRPEWTEKDFERFYKAIEKFNNEPLANKRIAKYMGKHIDPNHVRYERQLYNKKRKLEEN